MVYCGLVNSLASRVTMLKHNSLASRVSVMGLNGDSMVNSYQLASRVTVCDGQSSAC